MIVMTMRGGLGNQMFEYAFARAISLQNNNETIYLYIGRFDQDKLREYSLSNFALNRNIKIINKSMLLSLYIKIFDVVKRIVKLDEKNVNDALRLYKYGYYMYLGRKYVELPNCNCFIKYYSTLAQNKKYFEKYRTEIIKEFAVKTLPSSENEKWINKIKNTPNSVCVHVRRGDYVNSELYYLCDDNYFYKSITKMNSMMEATYYIFSEDINYVKDLNLEQITPNIEYVNLNNPDYEELRLMSLCDHFIISNSTFSWWAQELSNNSNKIVISPAKWKNSDCAEDSQLIENDWIKIE